MSDERLQILRMVQEGKVSADEAAKLLDALEAPAAKPAQPRARHVRIAVTENGKTKNFSVGIGLASWGGAHGKIFEAADEGRRIEIWLDA